MHVLANYHIGLISQKKAIWFVNYLNVPQVKIIPTLVYFKQIIFFVKAGSLYRYQEISLEASEITRMACF